MGSQEKCFSDWAAATTFADQLQDLSNKYLQYSEKRKIIVNHCELYIHYYTGDLDNCMRLFNEN